MPIYEYECAQCKHHFDTLQKISDPNLTNCPKCHQKSLHKLISPAGFQLKGTGWYQTDFKTKEAKTEVKKKSESSDAKES